MLNLLTISDLKKISSWGKVYNIYKNTFNCFVDVSSDLESQIDMIQNDSTSKYFGYCNASGELVGVIKYSFLDISQEIAFIDFFLSPGTTPGTALRVLFFVLEFAYKDLGFKKTYAEIAVNDEFKIHVYRKSGFTAEGYFRSHLFHEGQRVDVIRFGMLENEWSGKKSHLISRIKELDTLADMRLNGELKKYQILILSDSSSWINPYIHDLIIDWSELGHQLYWSHQVNDLPSADFCFCLGFGKLVPASVLKQYSHTLVVHESSLPSGKGWSPLTWQILEGINRIPVTLFEASEQVDSGPIYAQRWIEFEGNELVQELRLSQANVTKELCNWFIFNFPESIKHAKIQTGTESHYRRRLPNDSELDPNKSIAEQFDLLRVVDNQQYPAFFRLKNSIYKLIIQK